MKAQIVTEGIVLRRVNFQETNRILTILTPDQGKITVIAKGVRRSKSKLAGGIELFSVSHITFLPGKNEIGTLISTRLNTHYANIVKDINRTMLGYEILKIIDKSVEEGAESAYFTLLKSTLIALDDLQLDLNLVELWFDLRLLMISGHAPLITKDVKGNKLDIKNKFVFDFEHMGFIPKDNGSFSANHIKLLRLAISLDNPAKLKQITGSENYIDEDLNLAKTMLSRFIRI